MQIKKGIMMVALIVFGMLAAGRVFAGQWIVGSVCIQNDAGQNVYGERLAVFLVSLANPVTADHCDKEDHPQRRLDCINNCHLDFFKQFQRMQQEPGYLRGQTVTAETGSFAFLDAPVGSHYVLIKFPSMVDGYKVAWQEPVTVSPGRISVVTLNEDNLVLPKNRRR
jgi:hypothetical protein